MSEKAYRVTEMSDGNYQPEEYYICFNGPLWVPLADNGFWADPDAYSSGIVTQSSPMTKPQAERAIWIAKKINKGMPHTVPELENEGTSGDMLERYARSQSTAAEPTLVRDVYRHLLARLDAITAERDTLREAATALRDDMLERAQMNAWMKSGAVIVDAGAGVWSRFNAALTANHSAPQEQQP